MRWGSRLLREEEERWSLSTGFKEKLNSAKSKQHAEPDKMEENGLKEDRKKILDKYYRIIKLDGPISLEEILDLEEDTGWTR